MDFFIHSHAAPDAGGGSDLRELTERHWSYMDQFGERMIARGPTFAEDRSSWTGSLHIVDLPSVAASRRFVELEPYNRAGLFDQHLILRFGNLLGRTMWEFTGEIHDPLFLVVVRTPGAPPSTHVDLTGEDLIVHGELLTLDGHDYVGVVAALQASSRHDVGELLKQRQVRSDQQLDVEIHDWELGGRR